MSGRKLLDPTTYVFETTVILNLYKVIAIN